MVKFNCCTVFVGRKKENKANDEASKTVGYEYTKALKTLHVKIEQHPVKSFETGDELNSTAFSVPVPFVIENNSMCNVKVMRQESPVGGEAEEVAYEGEDELEENGSIKRNISDFDLQAHDANIGQEEFDFGNKKMNYFDSFDTELNENFKNRTEVDAEKGADMIQTGHVSDPGIGKTAFWASPKLKRSCSNLEMRDMVRRMTDPAPPSKSQSFEQLQELAERVREDVIPRSPISVMTHCSADKVMLKKHSSSQILPSRSRKLWWKLFLWSHRNLHKPWSTKPRQIPVCTASNQQGGYTSDTLEPNRAPEICEVESPGSFTGEFMNKSRNIDNIDKQSWDGFHSGVSGLWPQNQWVAFSGGSSSFARVDEWVKDLEIQTLVPINDDNEPDEGIPFPTSPETGRSPTSKIPLTRHLDIAEEIIHANSVIQSLNSSSTVAHISGIGLKVIPSLSHLCSLRSVNLSSNFIVHIAPGSLPKGLHTLNLSRNKIATIEGLRELTRLRVLDFSYNRISRIGQGLSNCTLVKELYLAGNKISDIEGLHRLLKLTILDLSFNKITTTKALGQLVANYNTLQALNLLGNPIQSNINDDQLRKAVCGLLPKLVYLNKQSIKPQRARELLTDSVAKSALGNSAWSSRRKAGRKVSQGGTSGGHRSTASVGQKSRLGSKSQTHHRSKTASSALASSSSNRMFSHSHGGRTP